MEQHLDYLLHHLRDKRRAAGLAAAARRGESVNINDYIPAPAYAGRPMLTSRQGNDVIAAALDGGKPFMACRWGSVELQNVAGLLNVELGFKKQLDGPVLDLLCNNAGFFPHNAARSFDFDRLMLDAAGWADLYACWYMPKEEYVLKCYAPKAQLCAKLCMEPYFFPEDPWSAHLSGKTVLVVHPFADTIAAQYARKEQLFPGTNVLPDFTLKTLKAVQSMAGEETPYADWFAALDAMTEQMKAIDYDVAVIGCGAYGMALAARAKQAGKQAIHIGGPTQFLFGIKGARFDKHDYYTQFYNDAWVRPAPAERPKAADSVENACYW